MLLCARSTFPLEAEVERTVGSAEIVVPRSVLRELDALVARGVPDAGLARSLADRYSRVDHPGSGDDSILALALACDAVVVTADRDLSERLLDSGRDVLTPRDRDRLVRKAGHRWPSGNG